MGSLMEGRQGERQNRNQVFEAVERSDQNVSRENLTLNTAQGGEKYITLKLIAALKTIMRKSQAGTSRTAGSGPLSLLPSLAGSVHPHLWICPSSRPRGSRLTLRKPLAPAFSKPRRFPHSWRLTSCVFPSHSPVPAICPHGAPAVWEVRDKSKETVRWGQRGTSTVKAE